MSTRHITDEERALYVIDGLASPAREQLEQHVMSCPACAAALADEARFELLLHELPPPSVAAPAPVVALPQPFADPEPPPLRASMRRRWEVRSVWALAAAAALLFWVKLSPNGGPSPARRTAPQPHDAIVAAEQSLTPPSQGPELLACNLETASQCSWGPAPGALVGSVSLISLPIAEMELDNASESGSSVCDAPEAVACSGRSQTCGP